LPGEEVNFMVTFPTSIIDHRSFSRDLPSVICPFPYRNPLSPRQRCQKTVLISQRTSWETPRGRYDEHSSKFSLSIKPKFNRPIGERNHFWRMLLADFGKEPEKKSSAWLTKDLWRQQQRGTCTQHNQTTLPQLAVRLSISLVC
jgi:hypothetical protein